MSQSYFEDFFNHGLLRNTPLAVDDPDVPQITCNDVGPVSALCHVTKWYLERDAKLARMFPGDKIEVLDTRFPFDSRDMPRLQIYGSTDSQERRPTKVKVGEFEIFVGVRFLAEHGNVIPSMTAGVSDVIWHIKKIMTQRHQLKVWTTTSENVGLALRSNAGEVQHIYDVVDERGKLVVTHELPWIFTTHIDEETGQFRTIASAGGD